MYCFKSKSSPSDEPTSSLDEHNEILLMNELISIKKIKLFFLVHIKST